MVSVKTIPKSYSWNDIKPRETHWRIAAATCIRVFPGKTIDLNFVVSLLGNILAKATFYTCSFIMVFLSLSRFPICVKDWGFTCVIFRISRLGVQGKILVVRACSRNVIEILILVISSISGLLARPLVKNLGFPKQETSEKFIWMNCSCELMVPSAFTQTCT